MRGVASAYAPDATVYDPMYEQPLRGRDSIRQDIEDFFQAFFGR
jgi:ketosteroid isomerase-like protein